jgi:hypothetical protein
MRHDENEVVAVCTQVHGPWRLGDILGVSLCDPVLSIVLERGGAVTPLGPGHLHEYFSALYAGALEVRTMAPVVHQVARLSLSQSREPRTPAAQWPTPGQQQVVA